MKTRMSEEQGWHRNTEFCVNLKTLLRSDRNTKPGKEYTGVLRHDVISDDYHYDEHFTFVEYAKEKKPTTKLRNPIVFAGNCVNVHRLADGTLRLDFNRPRLSPDTSFRDFCLAAAQELLTVARLIGGDIEK